MTIVADDYQHKIIQEVGDPNGTLAATIPVFWDIYAEKGLVSVELQALYTKRSALDMRMAEEQKATDFRTQNDVSVVRSQRFDHVKIMRFECQTEIVRIEARLRAKRAPVFGALTTVTPTTPPFPGGVDRNEDLYQGTPYTQVLPE